MATYAEPLQAAIACFVSIIQFRRAGMDPQTGAETLITITGLPIPFADTYGTPRTLLSVCIFRPAATFPRNRGARSDS